MPFSRVAWGRPEEARHPDTLKCALAEFISTLIFVFAGEGSGMAFSESRLLSSCRVPPLNLTVSIMGLLFLQTS